MCINKSLLFSINISTPKNYAVRKGKHFIATMYILYTKCHNECDKCHLILGLDWKSLNGTTAHSAIVVLDTRTHCKHMHEEEKIEIAKIPVDIDTESTVHHVVIVSVLKPTILVKTCYWENALLSLSRLISCVSYHWRPNRMEPIDALFCCSVEREIFAYEKMRNEEK